MSRVGATCGCGISISVPCASVGDIPVAQERMVGWRVAGAHILCPACAGAEEATPAGTLFAQLYQVASSLVAADPVRPTEAERVRLLDYLAKGVVDEAFLPWPREEETAADNNMHRGGVKYLVWRSRDRGDRPESGVTITADSAFSARRAFADTWGVMIQEVLARRVEGDEN